MDSNHTTTIPTPCPACQGSGHRVALLPQPSTWGGQQYLWLRCVQCRGDGHADAPEEPAAEWMVPWGGHPGLVGGVLEAAGEVSA